MQAGQLNPVQAFQLDPVHAQQLSPVQAHQLNQVQPNQLSSLQSNQLSPVVWAVNSPNQQVQGKKVTGSSNILAWKKNFVSL